jgi:putative ABC transport system ATP-binding protein
LIEVKNISKIYGKKEAAFTALDKVDFSIAEGSTVAIIGRSGSGKSTLMHIMSGLDHPTEGQVWIDGTVLHDMKRRKMDDFRANQMSFIFQSFFVEANQTCYQNVALPLEIAKVSRRRRRIRVLEALKKVELESKVNQKANNLSGGQKQRLAIARAIVNEPKLIFADEPTGNLDSITGDHITDLLFGLNKKLGCTLVIVTHDPDMAARCETQIYLKDGKIESIKTKKKPARKKTIAKKGKK